MRMKRSITAMLLGACSACSAAGIGGCASGSKKPITHQPPVPAYSDGASPTAGTMTPVAKDARPLRALIGNSLGAGGGFVCGCERDKIDNDKQQTKQAAISASQRAEKNPAKLEDVDRARTADLNADGFVTLDEIVALRQAELNDAEILSRLARTNQVFDLTEYQQDYLRTRGVSDNVLRDMQTLNRGVPAAAARTASTSDGDLESR
jgi:hypothetical protein